MKQIEKYEYFYQIFRDEYKKLASEKGEWKKYLKSSAQFYKYKFEDQVLIYAQAPTGEAFATYEEWRRIGLQVSAGSHGIALLVRSKYNPHTITVFDGRYVHRLRDDAKAKTAWKMQPQFQERVNNDLIKTFGVEKNDDLARTVMAVAEDQVNEYWEDIEEEIDYMDSNLHSSNDNAELKRMQLKSIQYILLTRLNLDADKYISDEDLDISNANTIETLESVGNPMQYIARGIFNVCERSVQIGENYEKRKEMERKYGKREDQVQESRGYLLSTAESGSIRTSNDEIRKSVLGLSRGAQTNNVWDTVREGNPLDNMSRDGRQDRSGDQEKNGNLIEEESSSRQAEGYVEVGGLHDTVEDGNGERSSKRNDLQQLIGDIEILSYPNDGVEYRISPTASEKLPFIVQVWRKRGEELFYPSDGHYVKDKKEAHEFVENHIEQVREYRRIEDELAKRLEEILTLPF